MSLKKSVVKIKKRGLSVMIGYILLISIAVVMSTIVYQWVKTYVPRDALNCPEEVSIFIKDISYDCTNGKLTLSIKNNGKFAIAGYFIHVTNKSTQEVATIDISSNLEDGGSAAGSSIIYSLLDNDFGPENKDDLRKTTFDVSSYGTIYKVDLIPVRYQQEDNRERLVSCSQSRIIQEISCNR